MKDLIEDGIDMGRAYRWWVFGVQRALLAAGERRAQRTFGRSCRPGPWGSWLVWCDS